MNNFYLGFDISTSRVGISVFDEKANLIELKHLLLNISSKVPQKNRLYDKAKMFREYINEFKEKLIEEYDCNIKGIFVEEPLISSNNQFTTMLLQKFNGMCCLILNLSFSIIPDLISVNESRKLMCPELVKLKKIKGKIKEVLSFPKNIDKKEYIWKKVDLREKEKNNKIEWVYNKKNELKPENFDMADSFCVGYAGLKKFQII